jgi:hypothetical protein
LGHFGFSFKTLLHVPQMTKAHIAASLVNPGGDGRDRTADLLIANQSLSQLSYAPNKKEKFYAACHGASILLMKFADEVHPARPE